MTSTPLHRSGYYFELRFYKIVYRKYCENIIVRQHVHEMETIVLRCDEKTKVARTVVYRDVRFKYELLKFVDGLMGETLMMDTFGKKLEVGYRGNLEFEYERRKCFKASYSSARKVSIDVQRRTTSTS